MSLRKDAMLRSLASGLPPRIPSQGLRQGGGNLRRAPRDYTPLSWKGYFDTCDDVHIAEVEGTFRVYLSGFNGEDGRTQHAPLLILLHGGGYSGLSWATFVKSLKQVVFVKVAAIDIRGHGSTKASDDDLSIETLSRDVSLVIQKLITEEDTRIILMGHSMGGAIAVHSSLRQELSNLISGLVVIDVVEGTALEALQGMQSFLRGRPKDFPSLENAIEWSVRSGQTKNVESARISMPSQLTPIEVDDTSPNLPVSNNPRILGINSIQEEEGERESSPNGAETRLDPESKPTTRYKFRIDLTKSEGYWRGWFEGLSNHFLSSPSPAKLLLLAGVDRLDRTLTIGQMQGKYQMQVLPGVGHAVHEDVPDEVAQAVATFLIRNQLTSARSDDFHPTSFPGC